MNTQKRSNQTSAGIFLGKSDPATASNRPTKDQIAKYLKTLITSERSSLSFDSSALNILSVASTYVPTSPDPQPSGGYKLVMKNSALNVFVYSLSNGLRVNIKKSDSSMSTMTGLSYIEIVALGGKNTEGPDIKGSCEFVNSNINGGAKFVNSDAEVLYFPQATTYALKCEGDTISLSANLGTPCANYPTYLLDLACTVNTQSYADTFKILRLSMNPIYNNLVKQKVISNMQRIQAMDINDQFDSMTDVSQYATDKILKSVFPDENRLHLSTLEDIKQLNPLLAQKWVSQHFTLMTQDEDLINRYEINIVGDVNIQNILPQLDKWFGSIPRVPKPKDIVGYDIYDKDQIQNFNIQFPTNLGPSNSTYTCEIPSYSTDKALVTVLYPGNSVSPSNPSLLRAQLYSSLLSDYSFDVVRSKGGFGYFAVSRTMPTALLNGFGISSTMFLVGDYPNYTEDRLNIQRATNFWLDGLKQNLDEKSFDIFRNGALARYSWMLDKEAAWMRQIRGLSLTSPATYPSSQKFLRAEDDIDIRAYLRNAKYEDFAYIFSSVMQNIQSGISSVMLASDVRNPRIPCKGTISKNVK